MRRLRCALSKRVRAALSALPATLTLVALIAMPAAAADGAALFKQHCATCHQDSGAGTVGLAPSLLGEHWQRLGADRGYLPTVMLKGLSGAIKVGGVPFVGAMPGLAGTLDDVAVAAVATHLRGLQGAAGGAPYTAAEVAEWRARPGHPGQTRALRRQILGD